MPPSRSAFARLRDLLADVPEPAGVVPVPLHLGEARLARPPIDPAVMADPDGWTRYPELGGAAALRAAYQDWLGRRFGPTPGLADGGLAVEPTPGTKQSVAVVISQAVARARERGVSDPVVVLPNPFYPTYLSATEAAGARPVFYGDGAVGAGLAAAPTHVAAVVVCHPGNPRGEVRDAQDLERIVELAGEAGALLVADECYTDLWTRTAPAGFLPVAARREVSFVVLHSLSKRSGAPGLRSGFAVGDRRTIAAYAEFNRTCGVSLPAPVCAAATALWSDDTHVAAAREVLVRTWNSADAVLHDVPGYRRADAGFFLWLPVPGGRSTTRRLWRDRAVMVMPGRFLAVDGAAGNPGAGHIRVALVHGDDVMTEALARLRTCL